VYWCRHPQRLHVPSIVLAAHRENGEALTKYPFAPSPGADPDLREEALAPPTFSPENRLFVGARHIADIEDGTTPRELREHIRRAELAEPYETDIL